MEYETKSLLKQNFNRILSSKQIQFILKNYIPLIYIMYRTWGMHIPYLCAIVFDKKLEPAVQKKTVNKTSKPITPLF